MDTKPRAVGNAVHFFLDGETFASPTTATATRARTDDVATIETGSAHGLATGDKVTVAGMTDATFNGTNLTITVTDATTFTYANEGDDVVSGADTGGSVTKTGTAGRESLPHDSDTKWQSVGVTQEVSVNRSSEVLEVWQPNPGHLELYDAIETKRQVTMKFTSQELTPLAVQALFGTADLTSASTDYTPLAGATIKGWLRVKQYDHDDNLFNTVWLYGHLTIDGDLAFNGTLLQCPFVFRRLSSTKAKGLLA